MKSDDNRGSRRWRDRLGSVRNQRKRRGVSCEPWRYRSIRMKLTEGTAPSGPVQICRAPTRTGHVRCHDVTAVRIELWSGNVRGKSTPTQVKYQGLGNLPGCAIPLCNL